jgi:hypothetical protein
VTHYVVASLRDRVFYRSFLDEIFEEKTSGGEASVHATNPRIQNPVVVVAVVVVTFIGESLRREENECKFSTLNK